MTEQLVSRNPEPKSITTLLRRPLILAAVLVACLAPWASAAASPDGLWTDFDKASFRPPGQRLIFADPYRAVHLDRIGLRLLLDQAPPEDTKDLRDSSAILSLPLPDGGFGRFRIVESPIMAPELAAKYPDIRTFRGQGLDDPLASVRLDLTPHGFHAAVISPSGDFYIDPYVRGDADHYQSYFTRDNQNPSAAEAVCGVTSADQGPHPAVHEHTLDKRADGPAKASGANLRTVRLAVAATGEYTSFHGGTVAAGLAEIVTAMNRVNGVFEREVALRMVLVANNDQVIYTNSGSDPYTNNNLSALLSQNQANLDAVIGNANYDIGHVFARTGGGLATLFGVCSPSSKARGASGLSFPIGDAFYIDLVAHEFGHQWSAFHSFNGTAGSCSGNRSGGSAYEPGSGSTIMAYAGICGSHNLQNFSDEYFHPVSYDDIVSFSEAVSCPVITATGNTPPVVDPGTSHTIPSETPFELCGTASDADSDPLTYSWEQFDRGPAGAPNSPSGDAPIFRSFPPVSSPCRTFPRLSDLLNNTSTLGEILPTYARTLHFRLTARDNRSGGGGVGFDQSTEITVVNTGPFEVLAPNTAVTWNTGTSELVSWDVANTDLAPISCSQVDIVLSVDGGLTYPHIIAAATPNDGSENVIVPLTVPTTTEARLKVQCTGNVFFDISNVDFEVVAEALALSVNGVFNDENMNGFGDPGETVSYTIQVINTETPGNFLTNISVNDPSISPITCPSGNPIPSLDGGQSETCTGTATLTQADIDAGSKDTATVADSNQTGQTTAQASVTIPRDAAVQLVKTGTLNAGADGTVRPGDTIDYSFQITNTGSVNLINVSLSDPLLAGFSCPGGHPIAALAIGASITCTGSLTLTQSDIDNSPVDNTATVTAGLIGGGSVNDQDSHQEAIPRVPFACTGDAYLVQNQNAQLTRVDQSVSPFVFVDIGPATGIELNNLGFRSTDGLLYALQLTTGGNLQVVQIDSTGTIFGLGRPSGLPTNVRFDAGDVSPDGNTLYITGTNQALYSVDLTSAPTLSAATSVPVTGAGGFVFDWAVSPVDGMLYGGDSSNGQLAILNPASGVRTDVSLAGLPAGAGYGGAWFDASGNLFLYQNDGSLYEIDLSGPAVIDTQSGPGASRNDGAACVDLTPPATGITLTKTGSLDLGGNGTTDVGDTIDYTFEITNTGTDALTNVTLSDPIIASFSCPSGHPIPSLAGGASETCTATYAITQADVDARIRDNIAGVTGTHGTGPVTAMDSHSEVIPAPPGAGPTPFACTGDAYIIQNQNAQLTVIDQSVSPFVFVPIGGATGIEINNLGFRSTDGLLYAVELTSGGNVQVIQIDATGAVTGLGRPAGLPTGPRFDAGDVSPDGSTMYITSNNQDLYALDLTGVPTLPAVTTINVTGATGFVFDWAVSPVDGRLYGGDSSQGQLAILDPVTGVRTDIALSGLPSGSGYGGAWFDAAGTLFLYQNSGTLYEIDPTGPTVVNTQSGPGATRNDGAACIDLAPPATGITLTKSGSLDLGGNGTTDVGDVIDYTFEITNTGTDALNNVTLSDPIIASFSCPSGHPIASLAGGASETCTATYAITQADVDARVRDNTATVTGTHGSGPVTDTDTHSEAIPAPPGAGPAPFACTGDAYIIQNQNAQLTVIDQSVSPFVFVPIGGATGIEINNLGFRSTDGLLYAVELTSGGNSQVIQIDATGAVFGLGRPAGLPTGPRFDAGDVSPDGSTMYITSNNQDLYVLDLTGVPTLPAVTTINVTGATGFVFDWAVSPVDGRLYGGDSTSGQLASINPVTGVRTDVGLAGLPAGSGYGGAWFDAAGTLFLYQNSGTLYEIDLTGPTVVNTQSGPGATRNDGAACINLAPPATGIALTKTGALDLGGNGTTDVGDTIDYTFEITNTGTDALTNVTLSDPIVASFTCQSGHPIPSLAGGASETCTATYAITQADVDARVRDNTATVTGTHGSGPVTDTDSHSEAIPAPPGAGPAPFACTGDAYIIQNQNAQLTVIDQSVSPFVFVPIGGATGIEINNLGFRSTDGLLYAVELISGGNVQIIQIDATGAVFGLGRPAGLPTGPRFDAGDVSPDGSTMYITANNQDLYALDLTSVPTLPAVTTIDVTGATGFVFDWAVSPVDGRLYGGDSTSGQLASIDPVTGVRTDVGLAGLPAGSGYGGAWFDADGTLFLYQNSGTLYEIDLSGPTVVNTQSGPGATRNDGAACINLAPPATGITLTKTGALDLGGNGTTDVGDTIDYTFEITNTGTDALTNVTLTDPIIASFTCPSGHPIPSLAGGASETCTATYALTQADVDARVRDNTATVTGTHGSGPITDTDSHSEAIPAPPGAGPVPFGCTGDAYIIQNQNAQLTRIDQSVSPFVFVPIGGATGIEINNLGFRITDGLLYAIELASNGNVQVIQIDATGDVIGLGRPAGLPAGTRFDAGDVSPDGSTMYITAANRDLYVLDLTSVPTLPAVTVVDVTGANGFVFDWAVSPIDGMLYGGDSTSGQLARIDPATGTRTDFNVSGLPSGSGYGGAWFDTTGRLFLYRNSGAIYEVDISGPSVVDVQSGPGATRNDGAACIPQP